MILVCLVDGLRGFFLVEVGDGLLVIIFVVFLRKRVTVYQVVGTMGSNCYGVKVSDGNSWAIFWMRRGSSVRWWR